MTALKKFERLECPGIWQASETAQRRDVIVSVGEATLIMTDQQETALVHWSLPAVERVNPGERPAIFRPGPDADDRLELTDNTMIKAIAKVQSAIARGRPHPGRLRLGLVSGIALLVGLLATFWLPGAMGDYTASVVPASKRAAIGESLLANIRRVSGKPCETVLGQQSLRRLHTRLFAQQSGKIVVVSSGVQRAQHLPGSIILLNRALVEDHEEIDVAAGYVLAENLRATDTDPLVRMLRQAGASTSFRLLTTGEISEKSLAKYAEYLLTSAADPVSDTALLKLFSTSKTRSTPYAYALDISGETTVGLIEADPGIQNALPILDDGDWVSLQGICGE
ncbi:MAG: hypothetical protein V3U96_05280 [Paracoccaceae bacterium]